MEEGPMWTKGKPLLLLSQLLIAMQIGNISWASFGELWMIISGLVQIEVLVSALFTTSLSFPSINCLLKFQLFLYRAGFDEQCLQSIILTQCKCHWMTFHFLKDASVRICELRRIVLKLSSLYQMVSKDLSSSVTFKGNNFHLYLPQ